MRLLCDVYRSGRKEELFLYVMHSEGLQRVPSALLDRFGPPEKVLTLLLEPGRQLARVPANQVMEAIDTQGFYLQLPEVRRSGQEILRAGVEDARFGHE